MTGKGIYIAGPITEGDQFQNVSAAIGVAERVRGAGYCPYLPHLNCFWHMMFAVEYEEWLELDFFWIERCDALLRIPGESPGSNREVAHARHLGLPVFIGVEDLLGRAPKLWGPAREQQAQRIADLEGLLLEVLNVDHVGQALVCLEFPEQAPVEGCSCLSCRLVTTLGRHP